MKTILGFLAGIGAGIGIGILMAPGKGSETRKKLTNAAGDMFDKLKGFANNSDDNKRRTYRRKPKASAPQYARSKAR